MQVQEVLLSKGDFHVMPDRARNLKLDTVRVVIVDDHDIVRAGLRMLLSREHGIHIAGMAATAEEGLELIAKVNPDVALLDYSLPGMSGIEMCEKMIEQFPHIPVIMLTTFLDDDVVRRSLEAGARAFVYKDIEGPDLKRAIRSVAEGNSVLDPKVARQVISWAQHEIGPIFTRKPALSKRETQVLRLIARGASDVEIAREIKISPNTVRTYLRRIFAKLNTKTRSEAAAVASQRRLI